MMRTTYIISIFFAFVNAIDFEGSLIARLEHDGTLWTGQGCEPVHGNVPDENCIYHIDDLSFTKEEIIAAYGSDRNGIVDMAYKWPAASGFKGQMAYKINEKEIGYAEKGFIKRVIDRFNTDLDGCLRIVPHNGQSSYINIGKDSDPLSNACNSYVGKVPQNVNPGQPQEVNIDGFVDSDGCYSDGTVVHELIHAWGFHHEHTRKNRIYYVEVIENNIKPDTATKKFRINFKIVEESNDFGVPYDGLSIMHYGSTAFSRHNPKSTTIKSISDRFTTDQLGTNNWMSLGDVSKLRQLYGCDKGSCTGSQKCDNWAKEGVCDSGKYLNWLKTNCKSSCNNCNGFCQDTPKYAAKCPGWAKDYGCFQEDSKDLSVHRFFQKHCRKTCNLCPSNCHDNDYKKLTYSNTGETVIKSCAEWGTGRCQESWWKKNCRRTCGLCLGMHYITGQQDDRSDMPLDIELDNSDLKLPEFPEDNVTVLPEFSEEHELPENLEDPITVLPEFSED